MGIIPVPPDFGNNCMTCFGAGSTPSVMKLFFTGITKEAWPDLPNPYQGYFDAIQTDGNPCHWAGGNAAALHWHLFFDPGLTVIGLAWGVHTSYFFRVLPNPCKRYFINANVKTGLIPYYGGWAFAATAAEMAAWIEAVTPIVGPDPRMGLYAMANEQIVLKFCNKQDGTNIKIKVDTTAL